MKLLIYEKYDILTLASPDRKISSGPCNGSMSAPNSSRASSRQNTGRLPMGWEDNSSLDSDPKRAALIKKQQAADLRKKLELEKKALNKANKTKEKQTRKDNKKNKELSSKSSKSTKSTKIDATATTSSSSSSRPPLSGRSLDLTSEEVPSLENLLKEIERLRYKNETLDTAWKRSEHENANLQMSLRRLENTLNGHQKTYDIDIGKLRKRVSAMQDRVTVVSRLETGLLELCLEVRDRSADDILESEGMNNPTRRHEASKRDLLKRCNNDVLVVLDHLR